METRTAGKNEVLTSSPINDEMMSMLLFDAAIIFCIMLVSIILTNIIIKKIDNVFIKSIIGCEIGMIISVLYTLIFK